MSVSVSDGVASDTKSFNLTLTNTGPTLAAIGPQTLAKGATSLTITLPASDADNDALTYQAAAQLPNAAAYQLNQQYTFQPANAAYYFNLMGAGEKWLVGKNNIWYALLPTGNLYRWNLSMAQTLTPGNLVASLDPMFHVEPRLLWDAK
ncbi:MAG: hypothetical protein HYR84_04880, partial [Planctomycetes bacterium]|nr:hypothetical protein [Planctomycetota bacterium]